MPLLKYISIEIMRRCFHKAIENNQFNLFKQLIKKGLALMSQMKLEIQLFTKLQLVEIMKLLDYCLKTEPRYMLEMIKGLQHWKFL